METIAVGGSIRYIIWLRKQYGSARWLKLKGLANVQLQSGNIRKAVLHWNEAHGIG